MKFLMKTAALLCFALPTTFVHAQMTASPKPQTSAAAPASKTSARAEAPGGGPGKVWVNTDSNVYHCPGTRYYGKTKAGKYMTEAQAKAAGAKIAKGENCSK